MPSKLESVISQIAHDKTHGAAWLARQALEVIYIAVETSRARTSHGLLTGLKPIAQKLTSIRPSMTPIGSLVARCFEQSLAEASRIPDVASAGRIIQRIARRLARESEHAVATAAGSAARLIRSGDIIFSGSYSSAIIKTVLEALRAQLEFRLIIAESKSDDRCYGRVMARELERRGLTVSIASDRSLGRRMASATRVMIGADTILPDGSIINGLPSLSIARNARSRKIPIYCVADTTKICAWPHAPLEPGFELIASDLVSGIITESGVLGPLDIAIYSQQLQRSFAALGIFAPPKAIPPRARR